MDDQHQTPFPQPMTPAAPYGGDPTRPPHRARRLLATATAAAVVAGVGGVGAGYAIGHGLPGRSTQTPSGGSTQSNASAGQDQVGGTTTVPGSGPWGWSDGQGGITVPGDPYGGTDGSPFSGQAPDGQSQSGDTTSKASGSQLTGLVRIVSTMKYDGAKAAGTGMVLTSDGEVVTNHHVVDGATSVKVKVMTTGRTYVAKVVGTDTRDDVAVLQLTGASGLSTVTPDTDGVAVGDAVTAVGDANGTVNYLSAATGSVLAENQSITTQDAGSATGERLTGLMEISSDVISGDSGGATYDVDGRVVGMTTAASSGTTDVVGYAVPIAKVMRIANDLERGVTSARYAYGYPAFLGVALGQDTTDATVQGVFKNTPAADAGLGAGDRITAIGENRVSTSAQLREAVAQLSPGTSVAISWTDTAGVSHTATVTLIDGPVA